MESRKRKEVPCGSSPGKPKKQPKKEKKKKLDEFVLVVTIDKNSKTLCYAIPFDEFTDTDRSAIKDFNDHGYRDCLDYWVYPHLLMRIGDPTFDEKKYRKEYQEMFDEEAIEEELGDWLKYRSTFKEFCIKNSFDSYKWEKKFVTSEIYYIHMNE